MCVPYNGIIRIRWGNKFATICGEVNLIDLTELCKCGLETPGVSKIKEEKESGESNPNKARMI